jgi:hypothetical protein
VPERFWCQPFSGVRAILMPALFWCQHFSGARVFVVPTFFLVPDAVLCRNAMRGPASLAKTVWEHFLVYASNAEKEISKSDQGAATEIENALDRFGNDRSRRIWLHESHAFKIIPVITASVLLLSGFEQLVPVLLALAADLHIFMRRKAPFTQAEGDYVRAVKSYLNVEPHYRKTFAVFRTPPGCGCVTALYSNSSKRGPSWHD